ncbi:MAG TPA: hypothetical protein VJN95_08825 [Gemmatimonadales bacterium]|nr:hypothetical protein [Gemmatimonadales bacterium]
MAFEDWDHRGDRFGLFAWERQLYLVPIHPFASIADSHRAYRVVWTPEPKALPSYIARDQVLAPMAGPFKTKELALARAAHPEYRHRFADPAEEEPA